MSHAWNACGANAPRGFKSHILRALSPRFSPRAGVLLCDAHLPAETPRKTVLPITLIDSVSPSPLHPQTGGANRPKHPFQVQPPGGTRRQQKGTPTTHHNGHQPHPRKGEKLRESGAKITPTPGHPAHIFGIWNDARFHISLRPLPQNWVSHVSSSSSGELQWRYAQ